MAVDGFLILILTSSLTNTMTNETMTTAHAAKIIRTVANVGRVVVVGVGVVAMPNILVVGIIV